MNSPETEADDSPVDEVAAAKILGVSKFTLRNWRAKDRGPPYVKYPRSIRYRPSMLAAWLVANTRLGSKK